ncbi:hypothetical protein D5270_06250 [Acutalibacter sp. 1XD8-36]|nr:hypothetical protein [Acutalibacter sp. 1XD8-36]
MPHLNRYFTLTGRFYLCYTYIVLIHYIFIVITCLEMSAQMQTVKRLLPILIMLLILIALVLYGYPEAPAPLIL